MKLHVEQIICMYILINIYIYIYEYMYKHILVNSGYGSHARLIAVTARSLGWARAL